MSIYDFDIAAVAQVLNRRKETKQAAKMILRYRALWSAEIDLQKVHVTLQVIAKLQSERLAPEHELSEEESAIDAALATQAIVSYCRTTTTSSSVRSALDVRTFLSQEQLREHAAIVDLRNQAVAHFGPGTHSTGPWATDVLRYRLDQGLGKASYHLDWHRINYRGHVMTSVSALTVLLHAAVKEERAKHKDRLDAELIAHQGAFDAAIAEVGHMDPAQAAPPPKLWWNPVAPPDLGWFNGSD